MKLSKTVTQWIRYARTDLRAAKFSLELSSEFKAVSAFHSQQCAEKIVKAYLVFYKVRVQKTHNMAQLLEDLAQIDPKLAKKLNKAKSLTTYAVTYRYPEAERKPLTAARAKTALKTAEKVFEICMEELRK